jgi:predicted porin
MKFIKTLAASTLMVTILPYSAQALELYNDGKTTFNFNGNIAVHVLNEDGETEMMDGFSRYMFSFTRQLTNDWTAFSYLEYGVQVSSTNGHMDYNNNALTATGTPEDNTWLRLGYVGMSHNLYGSISMGKQWGVTYDVNGITDIQDIFDASSAGVYNFGTDGGYSGVGRAEQAIQYRNTFGNLSVGLQYQAVDESISITELVVSPQSGLGEGSDYRMNFSNSAGVFLTYKAPYNLGLGIGYNTADIKLSSLSQISEKYEDTLLTGHLTYGTNGDQGLYVAAVFSEMENHEINDLNQVMSKAQGIELYGAYRFANNFTAIVTYNSLKDQSSVTDPSGGLYHKEYSTVGVQYHWAEDFYIYSHVKFDNSRCANQLLDKGDNAIGIGFAYSF